MGLFDKFKDKFKKTPELNITNTALKQNVEFVLYNLPPNLIKGIEIIEDIFDRESMPGQIVVKPTMNAMEIKREIGKFVYREKRWKEQEEIAQKLLAQEKIDLDMFYEAYETKDYLTVYEIINSDVFAVYHGNPSMTLDEIAIAINSLYIKKFADKNFSSKHKIENLVDELFKQQDE